MAKISFVQVLRTYREILYTVLSIIVVGFFTPLLLLICLPIYCTRFIISGLSKVFRRDLSSMLEARSTFLGIEDINNAPNATLLITQIVEGHISRDVYIKELERVMAIKRDNGVLKYKQMTEYLTSWMGFLFWTPDKKFDLQHHVRNISLDGKGGIVINESGIYPEVSACDVKTFEKILLKVGFKAKTSPWEFNIIPNVKPKFAKEGVYYEAIIYKFHHCLGDGYTLLKLFNIDICGLDKSSLQFPEFPKQSPLVKAIQNIYATIRAPFDIMSHILWKPDKNTFKIPAEKLCGNAKFHLIETDRIPLSYLKEIKNGLGVEFKTALFASYTAALRNNMVKRGVPVPESMTCMVPFPYPGHPDKMGNFWSAMAVQFPVGRGDPKERLGFIKNCFQQLKKSTAAITSFKIQPLIGGLFHWMVKPLAHVVHPTILASDMPGPLTQISVLGFTVVDAYFMGGFPLGNVGLLFFSTSYNGNWKMNLMVDHGITSSEEEAQQIVDDAMKELSSFHAETQV